MATWCHRHAWHAELWRDRLPVVDALAAPTTTSRRGSPRCAAPGGRADVGRGDRRPARVGVAGSGSGRDRAPRRHRSLARRADGPRPRPRRCRSRRRGRRPPRSECFRLTECYAPDWAVTKHSDRSAPGQVGDRRRWGPSALPAVRPPLERVGVVGRRVDHRPEPLLLAATCRPGDDAEGSTEHRPGAVEQRIQRAEPARLPDVDVLVTVDDAGPARRRLRQSGAADDVADRRQEATAQREAPDVDVAIAPLAERRHVVARRALERGPRRGRTAPRRS